MVLFLLTKQINYNGGSECSPLSYVLVDARGVSATVFPNPVRDKFTVKITGTKQPATYMLIDTMGLLPDGNV